MMPKKAKRIVKSHAICLNILVHCQHIGRFHASLTLNKWTELINVNYNDKIF